jgi:transcriptional regulator with XRE-family HTH domain
LKRLRQLCNLSQFDLAAKSNVGMHRIQGFERGAIELTPAEVATLGDVLRREWELAQTIDPALTKELVSITGLSPISENGLAESLSARFPGSVCIPMGSA